MQSQPRGSETDKVKEVRASSRVTESGASRWVRKPRSVGG